MQFTQATLSSTRQQFSTALKARGISLPFQRELNLWAQIVTSKNFSQATSASKASGSIQATAISAKSIQSALKKYSREVSEGTAVEVFAEAVRQDLHNISYCLTTLVFTVNEIASRCLIKAGHHRPQIGVMDSDKPGYLSLAKMTMFDARPLESAWIAGNAGFVVDLVNCLAGRDLATCMTIFTANHGLADQKCDRVFVETMKPRIGLCAVAVAQRINEYFDPADVMEWESVDFDTVRDLVYDSFHATVGNDGNSWLSLDCHAAEAMIDHVAARIRDGMKWQSRDASNGKLEDTPLEWVAHTTQLSIGKMLHVATL